eukprot:gene17422-22973_t
MSQGGLADTVDFRKNNFERVGVHWVATTFGGLFIATALMYWTGVFIDIKK